MTTFGTYSRYYNLLYREKDYVGETTFIFQTLGHTGHFPRSLLDLGCGTGRHAKEMVKRGVVVTGVDRSASMLNMSDSPIGSLSEMSNPTLLEGDARTLRLGHTFDAVTSLFHVMSYQTETDDALAIFRTARAHLKPGGVFLFDFWFGPCVLHERPSQRVKTLEDSAIRLRRTATPTLFEDRHVINVHYDMELTTKADGSVCQFSEDHLMRYWFLPELRELAVSASFIVLAEGAWMSSTAPSNQDWSAWMLAQAASEEAYK